MIKKEIAVIIISCFSIVATVGATLYAVKLTNEYNLEIKKQEFKRMQIITKIELYKKFYYKAKKLNKKFLDLAIDIQKEKEKGQISIETKKRIQTIRTVDIQDIFDDLVIEFGQTEITLLFSNLITNRLTNIQKITNTDKNRFKDELSIEEHINKLFLLNFTHVNKDISRLIGFIVKKKIDLEKTLLKSF